MTAASTSRSGIGLATDSLTPLHWLGIVLAVATGVLHLVLGVSLGLPGLGGSLFVAGVGYLGGTAAILVGVRRRLVYLLGIPFTIGQIAAWYVVNAPSFSALGIADKVVQVALIAVLAVLYARAT
ncbi:MULTISPECIES: hypothetical protein [Halobacterium]|uniref:Uncharacterized protein n=3 Tax=Halobacterium salinarum TaxID=2242 RepID=Q9HQT3_HALSA|nr:MULTISPECIES: hypothetical protein [Halobacterium]AAG19430.1 hypothetical protein VNG_1015H [Halobacterium salinarum NRC-1]MBB6090114.1 hypothetical protein [Halobacterium salinarum]MCF2206607.1 hypothetical protein [Halobacterium salinarum]MCF2240196.1 hypothetical protein [Halobacterium salinarum]MDL0120388.1 hypothetical protein [Halobacterium salinarum]